MKKIASAITFCFILMSCQTFSQSEPEGITSTSNQTPPTEAQKIQKKQKIKNSVEANPFYKIVVKDINGEDFSFKSLAGKKVLIVNTASRCGYTRQYADLQAVYDKYKDSNFIILGFPSNDFGQQEPGSNEEIVTFCSKTYGVTFPMMSKVSVKGETMCELYQFLTQKSKNGVVDSTVEWNFQKYLINEYGELEEVFLSDVEPTSSAILDWISR
jgi:glutathione peroxidase